MSKNHMNHGNGGTTATAESFEDRVDSLKDSVRSLVDTGSTRATEIKDRVIAAEQDAISTAQNYLAQSEKWIKANPLAAVGIAFGIGYFAMRMFRR